MIEIRIEDDIVNIYKDDKNSPIYYIRVEDLKLVRNDDGNIISNWIDQLIYKNWIEEDTLYELARIIQNKFPKNDIDWIATFFPFEKRQYVNHVSTTKKLISGKSKTIDPDNSSERVRVNVEEQNDFVIENLKKIIKRKLKNYGISI